MNVEPRAQCHGGHRAVSTALTTTSGPDVGESAAMLGARGGAGGKVAEESEIVFFAGRPNSRGGVTLSVRSSSSRAIGTSPHV